MSNQKKIIIIVVYLFLSVVLFVCTAEAKCLVAKDSVGSVKLKKYQRTKARAAKYYEDLAYSRGIDVYKKAVRQMPNDDTLKIKIAKGYYHIQELDSAVYWYEGVIQNDGLIDNDIHYINFGEALIHQGRYVEARDWFKKFEAKHPNDNRIKARLQGLDGMVRFYRDSILFEVENAPFNSEGYDFSPTFYKDGLILVSSRETANMTQFLKAKYDWDKTYFLNLFSVDSNNEVSKFDKRLKTSYHEGPVAFYENDTKVIFTRNSYEKGEIRVNKKKLNVQGSKVTEGKTGEVNLHLFYSELEDNGKWSTPVELWFNDPNFSCGHPTVSRDGQRLYFASNRPGGLGATDLYVSYRSDGAWGEPENLGSSINSEGSEMFPYVDENDNLYFASDGHMGLGGLDIFEIDLKTEKATPKNMGYPMNSASDDFGLAVRSSGIEQTGYFSSNRPGGKGLDDIYSFSFTQNRSLPGRVLDLVTGLPIGGANVCVVANNKDTLGYITTMADGSFMYPYEWEKDYKVTASKPDYSTDSLLFSPQTIEGSAPLELRIAKNLLVVKGTVLRDQNNQPLEEVKVIVTDENSGSQFGMITGKDGTYSFVAKPNTTYSFLMKKYRYLSFSNNLSTGNQTKGEIINDGTLAEIVIGKPIELDEIHFDLAKWNIRPDAAIELDKFTKKLYENPAIIVELNTHTDSRGGDLYNLNLSDKRAKSCADYVTNHGISKERLVGRGYGETRLLNECSNGVKCSEQQHQQNRRAEFRVTGFLPEVITEKEKSLLWISPDYISANMSAKDRAGLAKQQ